MALKYWARSASLGSKLPINSLTESKSIYTTCRNRLNGRTPYNIKVQDLLEKHNLKEIEIDLFHIVISLSLAARYLARFRVTSQAWGKL